MKKFERYICIFSVVAGFVAAYVIGYKIGNKEESKVIIHDEMISEMPYNRDNILDDKSEDVVQSESVVKEDAKLIIEVCKQEDKDNLTTNKLDIPVEMIGLTREGIVEYLSKNNEYFKEKGEEIESLLLVSFSPDKVVIRKNVHEAEVIIYTNEDSQRYNYYIAFDMDKVIVYKKDKTTVFIETGITFDMLDRETRDSIEEGVWIENISVLYRYLESITS